MAAHASKRQKLSEEATSKPVKHDQCEWMRSSLQKLKTRLESTPSPHVRRNHQLDNETISLALAAVMFTGNLLGEHFASVVSMSRRSMGT